MSIAQNGVRSAQTSRDERLQDHYKVLNRHLQAALMHARPEGRRERPEPCGGDSAMD
ncbi:hypothetical protein [Kaistia algarum]|uniref:hypothetical protein n=1 Tax=Kaistia algarum TaxID=2083279 RepID=UPI001403C21A|nr:hypothetical protein [Kaistia algarum]MCX5512068.1 hypothetical protein [Kaistia algarum]